MGEVFVFMNIFFISLVMVEDVVVTFVTPRWRLRLHKNVESWKQRIDHVNVHNNQQSEMETAKDNDVEKSDGAGQENTIVAEEICEPKIHHIDAIAKVAMPLIYFLSVGVYFLAHFNNS